MRKYEELAKAAESVLWAAPEPWRAEGAEVYGDGCDDHPVASCDANHTCRLEHEQEELAAYIAAASPDVVSALCADFRAVVQALRLAETEMRAMRSAVGPGLLTDKAIEAAQKALVSTE